MFMSTSIQTSLPTFIYQSFQDKLTNEGWKLTFVYHLGKLSFTHRVVFSCHHQQLRHLPIELKQNLVFHLGLIESFSYWKLAASPQFILQAGALTTEQNKFWRQLLINGMGEYFYHNHLNWQQPVLGNFTSAPTAPTFTQVKAAGKNTYRFGIGVGGGKDSAVMMQLLAKQKSWCNLIVTPCSPAAHHLAAFNGHPTYIIKRQFDPQLRSLNQTGMLNGHVPFSASLAFILLLASQLYRIKAVLVGNEASSSEATTTYLNHPINHQYSKSFAFEKDLQTYCQKFLLDPCPYYSLLRPLSELKIAQLFSNCQSYFSLFRSCNRGQQQHCWCQRCPKCLFVYLMLAPFIEEKVLATQIFSTNLLDQQENLTELEKLLGLTKSKPFECVGTIAESRAAFYLTFKYYQQQAKRSPILLNKLADKILPLQNDWETFCSHIINNLSPHSLPRELNQIVNEALSC